MNSNVMIEDDQEPIQGSDDEDDTSDDVPLLFESSSELNSSSTNLGSNFPSQELGAIDHCHSMKPSREKTTAQAKRKLVTACVLCLFFIAGEVTGGYLSHSLAIMSDAAHMLSDFASFCISLFSIWVGSKRPKKAFNYGYLRAEALGALFTIMIIWYVTGVLVYLACHRLANPAEFDVEPNPMMIVAGCAVVFNVVLGLLLHGLPHGHSHGGGGSSHSHEEGHINVRAAAIHVLGDLIQSIGVLISSIIIKVWPEAKVADPICTLMFSVIVMFTTITIVRDTVRILMEARPKSVNYDGVLEALSNIPGVVKVHDLRIWSMTVDQIVLTVHLAVNPEESLNKEKVLQAANKCLKKKFKIYVTTIQVEDYKGHVMSSCGDCSLPIE